MATGKPFNSTSRAEEVIAVLRDTTVLQVLENVAQLIISLPRDFKGVDTGDEPTEGVEDFLWFLWEGILDIAEEDAEIHPRLREFLKLFTVLDEPTYLLWGSELTLAQLPLLGAVSRDRINGIKISGDQDPNSELGQRILSGDVPESSDLDGLAFYEGRCKWLNLNRFFASLWIDENIPVDYALFALWAMRSGLERDPKSEESHLDVGPRDLSIETASIWVTIAGDKMYHCKEIYGRNGDPAWDTNTRGTPGLGGARWVGVDGYDPARRALWKQVFTEIANEEGRRPHLIILAKAAVDSMNTSEPSIASK